MQRRDVIANTPPIRSTEELVVHQTPMTSPPAQSDTMIVSDDRMGQESRYGTTSGGDDVRTIIIEPSFDGVDKSEGKPPQDMPENPAVTGPDRREGAPVETQASDKGHSRNLSERFFEAARLSEHGSYPTQQSTRLQEGEISPHVKTDFAGGRKPVPSPMANPTARPSVGMKHARGLSGDFSDPASVHRRMNSSGNSMPIDRSGRNQGYVGCPQSHHRRSSSGLDILSAAAGVSNEELAAAAGARHPVAAGAPTKPWDPPSNERQPPMRRSPLAERPVRSSPTPANAGNYEYAHQGPAPPYHSVAPGYPTGPTPPPPNAGPYHAPPYPPHPWAPPPPYQHHRGMSHQGGPMYPVQYAPPRSGDSYPKGQYGPPPQHPVMVGSRGERIESEERLFGTKRQPSPRRHPSSGMTTGVQTFVTAIGVGDGNKTIHAAPTHKTASTNTDPASARHPPIPSTIPHHRKMSSFGSMSTLMGSGVFQDHPPAGHRPGISSSSSFMQGPPGHHRKSSSNISFLMDERFAPSGGHHRSTSSSVSFLHSLEDVPLSNEAFMQSLSAQGPASGPFPGNAPTHEVASKNRQDAGYGRSEVRSSEHSARSSGASILASGGTSKRVRRKCTVEGCQNRVVQGGLCISHGAKRKQCKHPGCTKNVKKAGLCSTHGPARKRCEAEGCNKVAVQGGRCISHGAKKKLCSISGCTKQAILSGMCKKHHDQNYGQAQSKTRSTRSQPTKGDKDEEGAPTQGGHVQKPSHTRGLSIFQEISAESVQTLLSSEGSVPPVGQVADERRTESRGTSGSYYM